MLGVFALVAVIDLITDALELLIGILIGGNYYEAIAHIGLIAKVILGLFLGS